ncbi:hypothetical protein SETIT_3G306300v2 [Setaria italica]|uniref:GRF-type domain-containing protein n=1 Tax=Setaria italica TaxID=4555 RepID=A0A368QKK6_SETIT|nr:hypothetical protein SETIT_3G306300v2 [Setaria italica]
MTATGFEYKQHMGYMHYVSKSDADAPVPPAVPVPDCSCGVLAEVKQSRHPKTAGRAFYVWKWKFDPMSVAPCNFFQWVDEPDKYDPRIHLFLYDSTSLNHIISLGEEKQEATYRLVMDPPMCKCRVAAKLMRPNLGVPPKFTPFFRCSLTTHPTEEKVREFETGKVPWPCVSSPSDRCKCGILETQGVVPFELRYGLFVAMHMASNG